MATTITINEIIDPAPGKRQCRIIDTENRAWFIYPDKLGNMAVGDTIEVTDSKSSSFQGKTYITIGSWRASAGAAGSKPVPGARVPTSGQPPAPLFIPASDDVRRQDIFVCGAINAMLSNSAIDPFAVSTEQLMLQIGKLKEIWKRTLGPQPGAGAGKLPFNDEIPFSAS